MPIKSVQFDVLTYVYTHETITIIKTRDISTRTPNILISFPTPPLPHWPPRNGFGALWQSNPASKTPQRKTAKVLPYSGVLLDFNEHR